MKVKKTYEGSENLWRLWKLFKVKKTYEGYKTCEGYEKITYEMLWNFMKGKKTQVS